MRLRTKLVACSFVLASCTPEPAAVEAPKPKLAPDSSLTPVFSDVAGEALLNFQHFPGATSQFYFPEIMGSGVAVFDYDNDGDLDVYAVQSTALDPGMNPADLITKWSDEEPPVNRLYRNELIPGGVLKFTDVTHAAGVGDAGYGMGVAVGDVDNDGDADLFVSNYGTNRYYQNNGDGTFTLQGRALSVDSKEEWTTSASFFDVDGDGDLDLFATNYVGFTLRNNIECTGSKGKREYCSPNVYPPTVDRLWRNDGKSQFVDITQASGIGSAAGNGLGISATDFDGDGKVDVYVANDMQANRLWTRGDQDEFGDTALMSGSAYNAKGESEASMGVSSGDFDGDGDEDLFMTHLTTETNTLYLNTGDGNFIDHTQSANLAASSIRLTGFGTGWLDYDNDGLLDLFIANGAVVALTDSKVDPVFPYGQINQLLRNDGRRFKDVSSSAGSVLALRDISRGAGFGDVDNDGDTDIVVLNSNGPLRLMLNNVGNQNDWLRVKLVGTQSPRDGAGTRLHVRLSDGRDLYRRAHTDGSYLSASDIRVLVGLGDGATIDSIAAHWTSGRSEYWDKSVQDLTVNQQIDLVEGSGKELP